MPVEKDEKKERVAKAIARAGVCSRRQAEEKIAAGKVLVNGQVLTTPAFLVSKDDTIEVDGKPLSKPQKTRLWRYHKPTGLVTTHRDPAGRPTVFEQLPSFLPRVISVGRLDLNSEGLLLLTNDGELARRLELPETGWIRKYKAKVQGKITEKMIEEAKSGLTINGQTYGRMDIFVETEKATNTWVIVSLWEGKNREIRRVMEHFGLPVARLIRLSYGPFLLGNLMPGEVYEIPSKTMADQLGDFGKSV